MRRVIIGLAVLSLAIGANCFADPSDVESYQFPNLVDEINARIVEQLNTAGGLTDSMITTAEILDGTIAPADLASSVTNALSSLASGYVIVGNATSNATGVAVSGDITMATNGAVAIATGVIVNADVNAAAAIALTKLETVEPGYVIVGNASSQAVDVVVSGDVTMANDGAVAIASAVIVNADVNASAAIAHSKLATDGLGTAVAGTGTQTESVIAPVITVVTFTNVVVTATDGNAEGESVKVYDADAGQFTLLAAIANCSIISSAGTTGAYAVAFGTVAASDAADLTATEADIIPSTAIDTLVGTVLTNDFDAVLATPIGFDGTATAKDIYFNFGIADAAMDANNSTNTVTGTLTLITTKAVTNQ